MFLLFTLLSCSPKLTTCPEGTVKITGGEYRIGVEEPFQKWQGARQDGHPRRLLHRHL